MISKNLYIQIFIRVILMVASALVLAWIIFGSAAIILTLIPITIIILLIINTVYYLNRINRRIFFFFDAIRNEDSSLSFPGERDTKVEQELNRSLMNVNRQIQRIYEENEKQEQYFQALIEHAATGMFTFNKNGFILHSNQQARKFFGLEPFTHISQLEAIDPHLFKVVEEIQAGQQRLTAFHREEDVIQLLIKTSAFRSEGEELMLLSVQDIRNELDEKELDSWHKLIRVMRHEIMNSVTPITSLSESLSGYFKEKDRVKSPDQINEKTIEITLNGLELIRDQSKGLIKFVESYRELTGLPVPEKKVFSVGTLLQNISMLANAFPNAENVNLVCKTEPKDLEILADEKQILQVMINLVKNAYQATEGVKNARIEISSKQGSNKHLQISICDNGPGIPEDIMDKIFIPFFTTKEDGSGIGLSLSRQIMLMHGGSLKIVSAPGKQTCVILSF